MTSMKNPYFTLDWADENKV